MKTKYQKPLNPLKTQVTRKQTEIQGVRDQLARLIAEETLLISGYEQNKRKSARLGQAVQTLKARAKKVVDDQKAAKTTKAKATKAAKAAKAKAKVAKAKAAKAKPAKAAKRIEE